MEKDKMNKQQVSRQSNINIQGKGRSLSIMDWNIRLCKKNTVIKIIIIGAILILISIEGSHASLANNSGAAGASKPESVILDKKYYDTIQKSLRKSGVLEEQKQIAKEMQKKVAADRRRERYKQLQKVEEFSKSDVLKNEKMADEIFKKVKKSENEYKNGWIKSVDQKVKLEEEWSKGFVNEAENSIKKYSQKYKEVGSNSKEEMGDAANLDEYLRAYAGILNKKDEDSALSEDLYVAVSLSMPSSTLVTLSDQVSKAGGRLVIRGLKNNSFEDTVAVVKALSKRGVAIDINPKVFREFKIIKVPSFVVISEKGIDKMTGNVGLRYALEEFASNGDAKEEAGKSLVKLNGGSK
jgi:type-F conjugative transfer system pilin assembly protein TrbC